MAIVRSSRMLTRVEHLVPYPALQLRVINVVALISEPDTGGTTLYDSIMVPGSDGQRRKK